jgi:voltage-gated potassium channel
LKYLTKDPKDCKHQLAALPLLLVRGDNKIELPKDNEVLEQHDQILWCSTKAAATWMKWCWHDSLVLSYLLTGYMQPRTYFGRWLEQKLGYGFK